MAAFSFASDPELMRTYHALQGVYNVLGDDSDISKELPQIVAVGLQVT